MVGVAPRRRVPPRWAPYPSPHPPNPTPLGRGATNYPARVLSLPTRPQRERWTPLTAKRKPGEHQARNWKQDTIEAESPQTGQTEGDASRLRLFVASSPEPAHC